MPTYSAGTATVDVLPSLKGFHRKIATELKGITAPAISVPIDVDTVGATRQLQTFVRQASGAHQVTLNADLDTGAAQAKLAAFKTAASKSANVNAHVSLDTGAAIAKLSALSAAGAGVGTAVAGGVGVAGAALVGLPGVILAVLGPIAALTAGINGVPAAFKAFSQAEDQAAQNATSNAKAQAAAARQIVSARQQVTQAQTQLSRAYEDASLAQATASRRIQDAERQVVSAERAHLQARQDLNRALEDARRAQQDLAFQVQGGALAERQAVLDLADAREALDSARASGAGGDQLARVQLAYEQQALTLDEIRARNTNLAQDKAAADKAGIAGSEQVAAAQQRVADASQGVVDAQRGVQDAQSDAARVQVQTQRSIADAQLQVANAQSQLSVALQDAGTVGAANIDKINAAMAKLSPNARQFVTDVRALAPEFDAFKRTVQDALFAGMGPAFADFGRVVLPAMAQNLAVVAGAINGVTQNMLAFLATKDVADTFSQLFVFIGQAVTASGPVVQTFLKFFLDLATAAMPGIIQLIQALGTIGTALAAAFAPLIASGAISQAVGLLAQLFTALAPILAQILVVAVELWNAIGPALIGVVQSLTPVIGSLLDMFVAMAPTLVQIVSVIAQALLPIVDALAPVILALLPPISTLITAGLDILVPLVEGAADIFLALMPAIQAVLDVIAALVPVIAPLISQFVAGLLPVIRALAPVIAQVAGVLLNGLANALTTLVPVVLQVLDALLPMVPTFASIITTVIEQLLPIFQPLVDAFLQLVVAVAPLLPPLLELVAALLPPLIALIGTLMPIITTLASIFVDVLAAVIKNIILPVMDVLVGTVKTIGGGIKFLYDVIIKPTWDAIGAVIDFVWTKTIKPVFDLIGKGAELIGDAFKKMGDTIGGIWEGLKKLVHKGIQGVVDLVYNNGIRALVNAVIEYIPGLDPLPELRIPEFARGGVLPGYAPGKDSVLSLLSPGEAVLVPELVRALGPATILAANAAAMRGRGYATGGIVGGIQRFADGGVVQPATSTGGTAVTIDPSALAGLGEVAEKVTAQLVILATAITVTVVDAIDDLVQAITVTAGPAVLHFGQQTVTTAQVVAAQWTVMSNAVNASVTNQTTALTTLQTALAATRAAIQATADWAVGQFDRIRAAAADPIRWVLTFPINAGLINAWNTIDSQFALNRRVNPVPVGFAYGGRVFGAGTGTSDSIDARLSAGEFVIRERIARLIYPFLNALNNGRPEALQATGYAQGGIVAETGSQLNAALARGAAFAQAQNGKPYIWGGVGPEGYDCSGYMSAITNVLRGEYPHRRLGVARSQPWPGFVPGLSSAFATGFSATHTAGTLAGVNVEAGGSPSRVKFGVGAAGANSSQFGGHASLPIVGGKFVPGGGGVDFAALIGPHFADTYRMIGQVATLFAGNLMAAQAAGVATHAADAVKSAAVSAMTMLSSVTAAAGSPEVTAAVRAVAARFGWGSGPEWDALSQLISRESGWNPAAANPTSSARGLFQKMTSIHGPLEGTVGGQAEWGLNYIKGRYGSPSRAWAAWLSRSPHWYDQGGILSGKGLFYKGTNEPERVLSPAQTRAFDSIAASITRNDITSVGQSGGGEFRGELYLSSGEFLGMVDGRIEQANDNTARAIDRGIRG